MPPLARLLALVLSLLLIAAGAISAVELVAAAGNSHDVIIPYQRWWQSTLTADWNTGWVALAALLACAIGVLLLAAQLVGRRASDVALRERRPGIAVSVERRALERSMRDAVDGIDGVSRSRVRIRQQRATVAVRADDLRGSDLEERVTDAAQARLDTLDLARPLRLAIRVTPKEATP